MSGPFGVGTAHVGFDGHQRADQLRMPRSSEDGRVSAQRLSEKNNALQAQLVCHGDDIFDEGIPGDVRREAVAGALTTLVHCDHPICRTQASCQGIPFARMTYQPVQQHHRWLAPTPVPADKPHVLPLDHTLGPSHLGTLARHAGVAHRRAVGLTGAMAVLAQFR